MGDVFDVIVIGGGVAGVAAALAARADGASVCIVRASPGATSVTSGGWRGALPPLIADALSTAGLPYVPVSHSLPHPFGDLRAFDFASAAHAGALAQPGGVLCGISGLSGFSAPALARLYADAAHPPAHMTVTVGDSPRDGWAPHALAAAVTRNPATLADRMREQLPAGASHVVLPAVLGLDNVNAVRAAIEDIVGVPVFEALGAPPSIPGWRLDRALMRAARTAGVTILNGHAMIAGARNGALTALSIRTAKDMRAASAGRYILATGKFIGGGIVTEQKRLVESALNLPVWIEHLGQTFTTAESLTLTSRVRTYDQPLMKAGVHVDGRGQPLDARSRVVFGNVTAAGGVIAGIDTVTLGLGAAAMQGIAAAAAAATQGGGAHEPATPAAGA